MTVALALALALAVFRVVVGVEEREREETRPCLHWLAFCGRIVSALVLLPQSRSIPHGV